MSKVAIGPRPLLYPMPTVLVGAKVDGHPDFMAVAWCGIVNGRPPMISVALQHPRHTLKGIQQTFTFSVNIPSVDYVKETDYCGVTTGAKTDKVADCKFKIYYGKLATAPLIEQFPVNLECHVVHTLDLGSHVLCIGQIDEVYVTDTCLSDGKPDVEKIRPFTWAVDPANDYREFGRPIGKAFSIGKELKV